MNTTTPPKFDIPIKEDQDLRQLALDIAEGKVFTNQDCPQELLGACFMVVGLGGFAGWTQEELATVGLMYEYYSRAMGGGINGYPVFSSCQFVHSSQMQQIVDLVTQAQEARKMFLTVSGGAA